MTSKSRGYKLAILILREIDLKFSIGPLKAWLLKEKKYYFFVCNPKRGPYGVKYCGFLRDTVTRPNLPKKFRTQSIDPIRFCYKEWQCVCGPANLQVSSSRPRVLCLLIFLAPKGNIQPPLRPPFPTLPPFLTLAWRPNNVGKEASARGNGEHKFANPGGYMGKFEKLKQAYSL